MSLSDAFSWEINGEQPAWLKPHVPLTEGLFEKQKPMLTGIWVNKSRQETSKISVEAIILRVNDKTLYLVITDETIKYFSFITYSSCITFEFDCEIQHQSLDYWAELGKRLRV